MKLISLLSLGIPIFAYAETHYSFKGIYSRLKKKEPEIIADTPLRIEPGTALPILILVKDAHLFPVYLRKIKVTVSQETQTVIRRSFEIQETITSKFWYRIFPLSVGTEFSGDVEIDVAIEIKINGFSRTYYNDNYRISSHAPFSTHIAQSSLPQEKNFYWGDLHYHSAYTNDQVEFGAPLPATIELAEAMGLNFFAATEHSYDMDDHEDDYLKNDSNLEKWQVFQSEIDQLNQQHNFVIIPGEEVSAGNHKNQNIHFLIYNNPEFLPGKGDGAEKWLRNQPDLSIPQILRRLKPQALAVASHPEVEPPWLQKLLIRRGKWEDPDYTHPELSGLQIWNGRDDKYLEAGLEAWKKLILRGRKLFIYAGNDAHGNFNRFRQIGFPFFTFREMKNEIFGYARTGVFCEPPLTLENLLTQIRKGACVISNGPLLSLRAVDENGKIACIGESFSAPGFELNFIAQTTQEFGNIESIRIRVGDFNTTKETEWVTISKPGSERVDLTQKYNLEINRGYLRGVLMTMKKGKRFYCFTNPLWFDICKNKG